MVVGAEGWGSADASWMQADVTLWVVEISQSVCLSGDKFQGDTLGNLLLVIHSYPMVIPCDPCHDPGTEQMEYAHCLTTLMTNERNKSSSDDNTYLDV